MRQITNAVLACSLLVCFGAACVPKEVETRLNETNEKLDKVEKKIDQHEDKIKDLIQQELRILQTTPEQRNFYYERKIEELDKKLRDKQESGGDKSSKKEDTADRTKGKKEFGGLSFGIGIGYTNTVGRDRIESASVQNGIVRIDQEKNSIPRILLESHLLLTLNEWSCIFARPGCEDKKQSKWGLGPFVAIQPGTGEIIQAVVGGLMIGYKYDDKSERSFNLGIGASVEPNSRTLGDGLNANQALPPGDSIRYQNRTLVGITALLSHSW